jgi:hypothetical protein
VPVRIPHLSEGSSHQTHLSVLCSSQLQLTWWTSLHGLGGGNDAQARCARPWELQSAVQCVRHMLPQTNTAASLVVTAAELTTDAGREPLCNPACAMLHNY